MVTFAALRVGNTFDYGGNIYRKRSTRTAEIVMGRTYNPDQLRWAIHTDHSGVWAYFSQRQHVNQESYWWYTMLGAAIRYEVETCRSTERLDHLLAVRNGVIIASIERAA